MTWAEFKKMFIEKRLLPRVRAALAVFFKTLSQDIMFVMEYNIKFEKLPRYAPYLIPMDDDKIKRFARGLIPASKKIQIVGGETPTLSALLTW